MFLPPNPSTNGIRSSRQENPFRGFELATLTNSPEKLEQVASGRNGTGRDGGVVGGITRDPETNGEFAPENMPAKAPKGKFFVFQASIFRCFCC